MGAEESDRMLKLVGQPGRYAWIICILLWPHAIQISYNSLVMAVYGGESEHHCRLPDEITADNTTIPEKDGKLDSCHVYRNYTYLSGETIPCPDGWVYKLDNSESTVIDEWDMVCDNKYQSSLATAAFFIGVMVGGIICGQIADFTGRYPMLVSTMLTLVILGVMVYFVKSVILFMILRFLFGVFEQGLEAALFVLIMEHSVISRTRAVFSGLFLLSWSTGVMLVALAAYLFRNWRYIQLGISLPVLLSLSTIWFIPESLRWEISKGKFQDALEYMKKAAKFNKITLPENMEDDLRVICDKNIQIDERTKRQKKFTLLDGLRRPNLRRNIIIIFFAWFGTAMVYYGLSLQASNLSGNKYLNYFINGAIEVPAHALGIFFNIKIGRRIPLIGYFMIAGTCCIIAGVLPNETGSGVDIAWVSTMLAWIGKYSAAGCFSIVFLFSSEIFPTIIRNAGLGGCRLWSSVGALVASQINLIASYTYDWIPIVIFGATALIAGFLTLFLPETINHPLPDTIEEAENLGRKHADVLGVTDNGITDNGFYNEVNKEDEVSNATLTHL